MTDDKIAGQRVVVIMGAGSGIGRAAALRFAEQGARVVVGDISEAGCQQTVRLVEEQGGVAHHVVLDVARAAEVEVLVESAVDRYQRIDVMCNNAGLVDGAHVLDWTPAQYERVIAVNQHGVFYGIQASARAMRAQGRGGMIINTGSVHGVLAAKFVAPYQAAKAAVEIMTKVAARELAGDGIRVINVAPGVVDTPIIGPYRESGLLPAMSKKHMRAQLIRPEDVARLMVLLASDAANAVNGTTVYADDGYSAFK